MTTIDTLEPPSPPAVPFAPAIKKPFEHDRELTFARFSPSGKFLFAGSYDACVYRWELASGTRTAIAGHNGWVQGLSFHPDGKRMFTGDSWGGIRCWDYADAQPQPKWSRDDAHARWMRAMALSPDGSLLATCGADRIVRLWNAADGSPAWASPVQSDDLFSVAFHPGGSLVVGDLKGVATQWDVAARKVVRRLDAKVLYLRPMVSGVQEINDVGGIRSIAFDPTGKILACAGSEPATSGFFTGKPTVVLLDWETGNHRQLLQWAKADPSEGVTLDVTWTPDGSLLAASSGQPGKGAFYVWKPGETASSRLDKALTHCRSVSVHPDGNQIAVTQVLLRPGQSSGNGRKTAKESDYFGLMSQVHILRRA